MATAGPAEQRPDKLAQVTDPSVTLPDYYQRPFHAYIEGNLSWEAALEVELASRAVHATVMEDANVAVQPDGDEQMRDSYHRAAADLLADAGASALAEAERVVDLGCAVGLSSLAAARAFPKASVEGACVRACLKYRACAVRLCAQACAQDRYQKRTHQRSAVDACRHRGVAVLRSSGAGRPCAGLQRRQIQCRACQHLPWPG